MQIKQRLNTKEDYQRARNLRNNATPFEIKLWRAIREMAAIRKLKFRRQQAIHPFIVDFACMQARLLVELDGFSHDARQEYDKQRDADLIQRGFYILRFTNSDVAENIEGVVSVIFDTAERLVGDKSPCSEKTMSPIGDPHP